MLGSLRRGLGQKVGDEENRAEACSARGVVMRRQLGKSISLTAVEVNHGENALLDLGISDDDSVVTDPAEIRRKALSGGGDAKIFQILRHEHGAISIPLPLPRIIRGYTR